MIRILFIAAGPKLITSLTEQFDALGGFELRHAETEEILLNTYNFSHSAAVILDAGYCDAAAQAHRLREGGFAGSIVIIDGDAQQAEAVLTRPFRFADLLARLEAPPKKAIAENDFRARLTEKEAAILERLVQAGGAIIPKSALLADVWGYGPNVSTRTLETHIHRLRRKIEADPEAPHRLLTEGGGYRLAKIAT